MVLPTRTILLALIPLLFALQVHDATADQPKPKPNRIVGMSYENPQEAEFLKAVLTALGLEYTVTATPTGERIDWVSSDTAQELEIMNRVSQFWFVVTQCKGMRPPSPSQPALKSLSCEG